MIQYIRSLLYTVQVYAAMALMGIYFVPIALRRDDGAHRAVRAWCRYALWSARWMVGITHEVRGPVPQDEVMIAPKHQSFLDIIMLCSVLPAPKFVMKKELVKAPVLGWFALRMGCVPVDRGKKGQAIAKMMADVEKGRQRPGQLIIYPQGTRVAPGALLPYKVGTAVLYRQLQQPCVPVAVNVGLFWPRLGIMKRPGHAIIEFQEKIPAGVENDVFLRDVKEVVERRSLVLMQEGGWAGETA